MNLRPLAFLSVLAGFVLFAIVAESALGDEPAREEAKAALPALPWHMVNLWWNTAGEVADFSRFSIDVDISCDMPADRYNLYISPINGNINQAQIYGGIQSNCNGWDAMKPADKKRRHGGPGFIFSRWSDALDLTLDDVRSTPGGFVETADYEGHFASTRRPYAWKAGKYTYSLQRLDTQVVNGKPLTWIGAFVHEHASGKDVFVGALRFAGEKQTHSGTNGAFLEFYATELNDKKPDLATLPPLVVKFSNLRFNGAPADLTKVSPRFIREEGKRRDGLSAPISPNIVRVSAAEEGREVTCRLVNKPVADAEEPSRTLWQKPDSK